MKSVLRCSLVIGSGLAVGAVLFALSFILMDFIVTHFIIAPGQADLGAGVMVVAGDS